MSNYKYITATTQVKANAGKLKGIFVSNAASTPTITIYDTFDGTTSGTTLVGVFTPTSASTYLLGMGGDGGAYFNKGLYIVLGGTVTATVVYE
jgi:hypothetical protein